MTGLEKIIAKIEEDCNKNCDEIIKKAQEQAQKILDDARAFCQKAKEEAAENTKNKCKTELGLALSRAGHEYKKSILAVRISIINDVISEAMQKLKNLPDSEYFNVITTLIMHYSQTGHGVLRFSRKDLDRMPRDFDVKVNEMLRDSGKSVEICVQPAPIDGGFIIVYNNIEQNCTFDTLLEASLDEIKDELYEEIFIRNSI